MEGFADYIGELGSIAIKATADLEGVAQFGNPSASDVREIVDRVTKEFNEHARVVEERSPKITSLMAELASLVEVQNRLFEDFEVDPQLAGTRFEQLLELYRSTLIARQNTQGMIDSVSTLPRMSADFNLARQRIVRAYDPFLREIENTTRAIERTMAAMRNAIPALDTQPALEIPAKPIPTTPRNPRGRNRKKRPVRRKR